MFWGLSMVRAVCGLTTIRGEHSSIKFSFFIECIFVYLAAYLVFVDKRLSVNCVLASTDESWTFLSVLTGFFIFEEVTLIYFDLRYRTFSKELHLHHFFSFNGFFLALFFHNSHCYAMQMFLLEASTPFSCICWCLLKLKLEKTKVWKINQWILIYVFHARTFYELWSWYIFYHDWDNIKQNIPWSYIAIMFTGVGISTFWLTPYWTYKKTAQFFFPVDWNAEVKGKKKDEIDKTS